MALFGYGATSPYGLAKNMRRLHTRSRLKQEALPHDCGINRAYLSSVERSERNVSIATLAGSQRSRDRAMEIAEGRLMVTPTSMSVPTSAYDAQQNFEMLPGPSA
jgi:transcriptional regulator with XRE-family HTH domain